jgi:DNA-binding MurR/RpiR family transcriptional regulator
MLPDNYGELHSCRSFKAVRHNHRRIVLAGRRQKEKRGEEMFREQIRKHYDHLSRSYRRVADFILGEYRTAAFMTAAALADAVEVDTTTVVRFAQRLGYPGFPELIEDIQTQVKLELSQTYDTAADSDALPNQVQAFVARDRANIEKLLPTIASIQSRMYWICCVQRRGSS